MLYASPELQRSVEPGRVGWRSRARIWELDAARMELPETARRFELSTMAYGCAGGLARSIEYLLELGVGRIRAHDRALAEKLAAGLEERGAKVFRAPEGIATGPIVSAALPGREAAEVAGRV